MLALFYIPSITGINILSKTLVQSKTCMEFLVILLPTKFGQLETMVLLFILPNYLLGWATQASGVTENLNDVCMINENEGYAVGDNGTILHFTSPAGLRDKRDGSGIIVYNNLANNRVAISCPDNTYVNFIQVHGLSGEIVNHFSVNRVCNYFEFDLSDVDGGLYVLKIDTNMGSKSKKLFFH